MDYTQLIESMRSFEADHDPNGWPAVRMHQVSALCNALEALQARVLELGDALAALEITKDGAYAERNRLVALLSKVFPSGKKKTVIEGWSEDWHGCVYINLPTGQASWHYHDSQGWLFEHLPEYQGVWDGHTTNEKYERIAAFAALAALRAQPEKLYTQDDLNREFDEGANRQAEIWKSRLDMERQRAKHIEEMNRTLLEHLAKVESLTKPPMILMVAQPKSFSDELREVAKRAQPDHSVDANKMVKLSDDEIKAIAICKKAGNVSVSRVQRLLNIGYNQAQTLCESIIYAGQVDGLEVAPSLCGARNKRAANVLEGKK